jgi:ABC-2 type transport system permease protein
VITMFGLEVKRMVRDFRFFIFTIGMPIMIYVMSSKSSYGDVGSTPIAKYMLVSMATFGAIGSALSVGGPRIAEERKIGWTRQLRLTPMGSGRYVVAKVLTASVMCLASVLLIFAFGLGVKHVSMTGTQWLGSGIAVWIGSLVFAALSILLGYLFTPTSITVGLMVVNLGFSFLGGLFWPVNAFPSWLKIGAYITPTYHLSQLGHAAQMGNFPAMSDVGTLLGYLILFGALAGWLYQRDETRG